MRYRWQDIPALLRTPAGRIQFREGVLFRLWPVLSTVAIMHRRTLARRVRIVAVVGSLGKSTTARAVAAALGIPEHPAMSRNAWSSVALALLRARPGQRRAVIEVGIAGPGQMRPYARTVQPQVTVVTSIASEHHRSLGTLEATRDEKAWMVRALPASGVAVLNGDDANVLWMRGETSARVVTFGFDPGCDVQATQARMDWPRGTQLMVRVFGDERRMTSRLIGHQQVRPILAALAVAHVEGVSLDDAVRRLEALAPTPGRLQPVLLRSGAMMLRDDFKSSLETVHAALDALDDIPAQRRLIVLGDISEPPGREGPVYRDVGLRAARVASHIFIAGSPQSMERYRAGVRSAQRDIHFEHAGRTPREVAQRMQGLLQPGDVVLLKGRDTQRLDRVRLLLEGKDVRCNIRVCHVRATDCEHCPMLGKDWGTRRQVT